jgi:hypothetical protein
MGGPEDLLYHGARLADGTRSGIGIGQDNRVAGKPAYQVA